MYNAKTFTDFFFFLVIGHCLKCILYMYIFSDSLGRCSLVNFQVTGSNKGIGYAIVRALCKQFDGDVFLTGENTIIHYNEFYVVLKKKI